MRATAKKAGCSVTELDKLTAGKFEATTNDIFPAVEPWTDPVEGIELITDMVDVLRRHVVADLPTLHASALWAVHTWCMDAWTVSPLAHISAAEKRCGKTVLLTALQRLSLRSMPAANISPAALFRAVEKWQPALMIDEADSFLKDNEEARGLINSGLYRENAFVIRCVGDTFEPTRFSTWGAKALCGIGRLADTIEDRSIPLRLRRKVAGETAEPIRLSDPMLWKNLQSRIARWVADNEHALRLARPEPVKGLHDRANDCWEPLLAVADLAGWGEIARHSALTLHGVMDEGDSAGVELLRDVQTAFTERSTTRLASRNLLEILTEDDEAPWATWNRGKPITARQLTKRLADFGISSRTTRLPGSKVAKGYHMADFTDSFNRYLCNPVTDAKGDVTATVMPATRTVEALLPSSRTNSQGPEKKGLRETLMRLAVAEGVDTALVQALDAADVDAC